VFSLLACASSFTRRSFITRDSFLAWRSILIPEFLLTYYSFLAGDSLLDWYVLVFINSIYIVRLSVVVRMTVLIFVASNEIFRFRFLHLFFFSRNILISKIHLFILSFIHNFTSKIFLVSIRSISIRIASACVPSGHRYIRWTLMSLLTYSLI